MDLRRESRMRKTHGCVEKSLGFAMGMYLCGLDGDLERESEG